MSGESTISADFDTDMQTIRDYVHATVEVKAKLATAYLSAIDNFQTTVQAASPKEAKPDYLGAAFKSGMKAVEKTAVSAVKSATGADLGPLVDMVHAIYDEVERAGKAAQTLSVANWIKSTRSAVTNAFTQDQSGEDLRLQIENEYKQNDEGGRGGYIAGIQIELDAMRSIVSREAPLVPRVERVELAMYEGWINQNFDNDCIDGTGVIVVQYDSDGAFNSATVNAPLGEKIAGALNRVMSTAGVDQLMKLDVVKKMCEGDSCMCFEGNNEIRKHTLNEDAEAFLTSTQTWELATRFDG